MPDAPEGGRPKRLLLVDGSSYLYRAFHALPDLRTRRNEPTGAIYGVINMLRRLTRDYSADYRACVFDAPGRTFRDDLYPPYKAHRPPMPEALAAQIEPLKAAIAALGWPLLVVEGVEADDVIGTLARAAERAGVATLVSTGDKDLAQLVGPATRLVNTMSNEELDEAGVAAKFGVAPERIVDYLALVGDAADNVPGVEKVGPKTAAKLLATYRNLDNLVAHAHEVSGAIGLNLRQAAAFLPLARSLLTVKTDVDLQVGLEDLVPRPADRERLLPLFERFEFESWAREIGGAAGQALVHPPALASTYAVILDEAALGALGARLAAAPLVSLDTETTGLDPMNARLVGLSFAVEPDSAFYIPVGHRYAGAPAQLPLERVLAELKPCLEDPSLPKVGHNIKFDAHILANHGIRLAGIRHDTLLESYVLESHRQHDMDTLALRHLGLRTTTYAEVTGKGANSIGFDQVAIDTATHYAAEDADVTLKLHQALFPRIRESHALDFVYEHIEVPLATVLLTMERNGVLVDVGRLRAQAHELGLKITALEQDCYRLVGQPCNLNSPKQLQEILFTRMGLPVIKKTPGGAASTDEEVLAQLALDYPFPKLLLEYRALAKLKSTYLDRLPTMVDPSTGRIHTHYSQATAVTGRLASSDPNLQNIPARTPEGRRIREAFIAPPGHHLVSADYSQIELRIMAHLSQDPGLTRAFAENQDVHRATAGEIFGIAPEAVSPDQRRVAKVINFGLIYGMSAFGLASQLGLDRAAAQQYIDRYFARYPGVAAYMRHTREAARAQGYVETVFGRRLWLPEINGGSGPRRQAAERAAINGPMQGTAADLIKLAMISVQGWLEQEKSASRLILQVHDELVLEVPDEELGRIKERLPALMCGVAALKVPLLAEMGVGPNWESAH
ncbi:MAG: DNA polymerase I [Betaproteobacteria bacterium]|nr:DNA polymerase I [Betaproteobacteria bacterium]